MRILFLTQIIPYPLDAGPKVKTFHVLRYLINKGHNVHLITFIRPEEKPFLPVMQELCSEVCTVDIHRSRLADVGYWLRSHFSGRPFLVERDDIKTMRLHVQRLLMENDFDAIHADQLTMCQFAYLTQYSGLYGKERTDRQPIRVFDAHNAVWTIVERMKQTAPFYFKVPLSLESRRIKKYEAGIVTNFEKTLTVTEIDRQALIDATKEFESRNSDEDPPITIIPIAVDTKSLSPVERVERSKNILTLGTLHYPPNADGIRWFANEVFPLIQSQIPDTTLTIIGKNPPQDLQTLASQNPQTIKVTGYVPDLIPYFRKAGVLVVPVRAGGGMRVRILEAFSRAMPVVTTTVGLEGIDAQPGQDVLVEDTAPKFAQAVIKVLNSQKLQNQLARNGRLLVEKAYDWQVVLQKLDNVYNNIPTKSVDM